MADEMYSKDYEQLLIYKNNKTDDAAKTAAVFFLEEYDDAIKAHFNNYIKKSYHQIKNLNNLDFQEEQSFRISEEWIENMQNDYLKCVVEKYLPQALNSFKPEKIKNKSNYKFITYLNFYLRHAIRDLSSKWAKNTISEEKTDTEESIIEQIDNNILQEKLAKVRKQLSPIDKIIFDMLSQGKKQCEIKIINKKTGKFYGKSGISKHVKNILYELEKLHINEDFNLY